MVRTSPHRQARARVLQGTSMLGRACKKHIMSWACRPVLRWNGPAQVKNRESAARSRQKKQQYTFDLETQVGHVNTAATSSCGDAISPAAGMHAGASEAIVRLRSLQHGLHCAVQSALLPLALLLVLAAGRILLRSAFIACLLAGAESEAAEPAAAGEGHPCVRPAPPQDPPLR